MVQHSVAGLSKRRLPQDREEPILIADLPSWALVDNEAVKDDRGSEMAEKRVDKGKILPKPSSSDESRDAVIYDYGPLV